MDRSALRSLVVLFALALALGLTACGSGRLPEPTKTPAPLSAAAYKIPNVCGFEVPKGWTIQSFEGLKYQIVTGPPSDAFAPNICVLDEKAYVSLKTYAEAGLESLPKAVGPITNSSITETSSGEGRPGYRIAYDATQKGTNLHYIQYCFQGKEKMMIIITYTRLVTQSAAMDAEFDGCMNTFRLE